MCEKSLEILIVRGQHFSDAMSVFKDNRPSFLSFITIYHYFHFKSKVEGRSREELKFSCKCWNQGRGQFKKAPARDVRSRDIQKGKNVSELELKSKSKAYGLYLSKFKFLLLSLRNSRSSFLNQGLLFQALNQLGAHEELGQT